MHLDTYTHTHLHTCTHLYADMLTRPHTRTLTNNHTDSLWKRHARQERPRVPGHATSLLPSGRPTRTARLDTTTRRCNSRRLQGEALPRRHLGALLRGPRRGRIRAPRRRQIVDERLDARGLLRHTAGWPPATTPDAKSAPNRPQIDFDLAPDRPLVDPRWTREGSHSDPKSSPDRHQVEPEIEPISTPNPSPISTPRRARDRPQVDLRSANDRSQNGPKSSPGSIPDRAPGRTQDPKPGPHSPPARPHIDPGSAFQPF